MGWVHQGLKYSRNDLLVLIPCCDSLHLIPGIFLENILKYKNDHSDKYGADILPQ